MVFEKNKLPILGEEIILKLLFSKTTVYKNGCHS